MPNRCDFYRLLQVQPDASIEVIEASYRTLMRQLRMHPDLGGEHTLAGVAIQVLRRDDHHRWRFVSSQTTPYGEQR